MTPEQHKEIVRQVIIIPMTTLFRPPSHIETEAQATAYLREFINTIALLRPDQFELEEVWRQFVIDAKTKDWPLPSVICLALSERRKRTRRIQDAAGGPAIRYDGLLPAPTAEDDFLTAAQAHDYEAACRVVDRLIVEEPESKTWLWLRDIYRGLDRKAEQRALERRNG